MCGPAGTPCPAWQMQHCHRERAAWPSVGFGELLLPHKCAHRGSEKPEQLFEMTPENTGLPLPQLEAESCAEPWGRRQKPLQTVLRLVPDTPLPPAFSARSALASLAREMPGTVCVRN